MIRTMGFVDPLRRTSHTRCTPQMPRHLGFSHYDHSYVADAWLRCYGCVLPCLIRLVRINGMSDIRPESVTRHLLGIRGQVTSYSTVLRSAQFMFWKLRLARMAAAWHGVRNSTSGLRKRMSAVPVEG
jgi:hypothetical protein